MEVLTAGVTVVAFGVDGPLLHRTGYESKYEQRCESELGEMGVSSVQG